MDKQNIVNIARTWTGTPFGHRGRTKGVAVDCIGLIIEVFKEANELKDFVEIPYSPYAPDGKMRESLERFCDLNHLITIQMADLLLFSINGSEQHVGIVTCTYPLTMIHSFQGPDVVSEHELNNWWMRHLTGVYTFTGDKKWQQ